MSESLANPNLEPNRDTEIAGKISAVLQSGEFADNLQLFANKRRDEVVGNTLEYLALDLDLAALPGYMERLGQIEHPGDSRGAIEKQNILVETIREHLAQSSTGGLAGVEDAAVFNYINTQLVERGYLWHGFNGTFEPVIRESGLTPEGRVWDVRELESIHNIFERAGQSLPLGVIPPTWYKSMRKE